MAGKSNRIKKFYDPHPGLLGCSIPIPEPVRQAANELNGKKMSLETAIAYIKATTDGEVTAEKDFIMLKIFGASGTTYGFRVIRFK